jgi:hypothetical protein
MIIFHNTIVDNSNSAVGIDMWMRICFGNASVRCPARVANADIAIWKRNCRIADFTNFSLNFDGVVCNYRNAPTIIATMFYKLLSARIDREAIGFWTNVIPGLKARLFNMQSKSRAFEVGEKHYDMGNDLYKAMLVVLI